MTATEDDELEAPVVPGLTRRRAVTPVVRRSSSETPNETPRLLALRPPAAKISVTAGRSPRKRRDSNPRTRLRHSRFQGPAAAFTQVMRSIAPAKRAARATLATECTRWN